MLARVRSVIRVPVAVWALAAAAALAILLPAVVYGLVMGVDPLEAAARIRLLLHASYTLGGILALAAVLLVARDVQRRPVRGLYHAGALLLSGLVVAAGFALPAHDEASADRIEARYLEGGDLEFHGFSLTSLRDVRGMPERPFEGGDLVLGTHHAGGSDAEESLTLTVPARRGDLWIVHAGVHSTSVDGGLNLRVPATSMCELQRAETRLRGSFQVAIWECVALTDGPATLTLEGTPVPEGEGGYSFGMRTYPTADALAAGVDEALVKLGVGLAFGGLALILLAAGRAPEALRPRVEAFGMGALAAACLAWPAAAWVAHALTEPPAADHAAFVQLLRGAWANSTLLAVVLLAVAAARRLSGLDAAKARSLACYGAISATVSLLCGGFVVFARDAESFLGGLTFGLLGFLVAASAAVHWATKTPSPVEAA